MEFLLIIGLLLVVTFISYFAYKKKINIKADLLIERIDYARQEYDALFIPSHFVTDKEFIEYSQKHSDLYHEVSGMVENRFVANELKDKFYNFICTYDDLDSQKKINNRFANEIELVDSKICAVDVELNKLFEKDHYFLNSATL